MKRYCRGFYMSLGMFTAIPLPRRVWDDNCKSLLLPCLPLVGVVTGALWRGFAELLFLSDISSIMYRFVFSAIFALLPFFLSGFLHLDGYMDTCDAMLSRRPLEEKLRILKDPHTGAFAVIMLAALFLLQFAAAMDALYFWKKELFALFIVITVLSRCGSALSFMCLTPLPQSEYAKIFRQDVKPAHKVFVIIIAMAAVLFSFLYAGVSGLVVAAAVVLGYLAAMGSACREFKGVSGDLTGFALTISELCGLIVFSMITSATL